MNNLYDVSILPREDFISVIIRDPRAVWFWWDAVSFGGVMDSWRRPVSGVGHPRA